MAVTPQVGQRGSVRHIPWIALGVLLAADIVFAVLSSIYYYTHGQAPLVHFVLWVDRGYPELFQYGKELAVALMLGVVARRRRHWSYMAWGLVFFYMLLDDALLLHEQGGELLEHAFSLPAIGPIDSELLGQLLIYGGFGVCIVGILIAIGPAHRPTGWRLFGLLMLFAVFAVGFDVLDVVSDDWTWQVVRQTIEDGGEMVVMSLVAAYVLSLLLRPQRRPGPEEPSAHWNAPSHPETSRTPIP